MSQFKQITILSSRNMQVAIHQKFHLLSTTERKVFITHLLHTAEKFVIKSFLHRHMSSSFNQTNVQHCMQSKLLVSLQFVFPRPLFI